MEQRSPDDPIPEYLVTVDTKAYLGPSSIVKMRKNLETGEPVFRLASYA